MPETPSVAPPAKPLCHAQFSVLVVSSFPGISGSVWRCLGVVKTEEGLLLAFNGQRTGMLINMVQQQDSCPHGKALTRPSESARCSGWDTAPPSLPHHPPLLVRRASPLPFSGQWTLPTFVYTVLLPVEIPLYSKTEAKHRWAFSALACSVLKKHRDCFEGPPIPLLHLSIPLSYSSYHTCPQQGQGQL